MAKVKGEASFDSQSRKVKRFESTPLTPAEYEGKLLPGVEIKKAAGKGKLPYAQCKLEVLNSAGKKGGKNRKMIKRFFLNTSPDADGVAGVDRGDGIVAYFNAIGSRLKAGVVKAMKEVKGSKTGELTEVKIIDPDHAKKALEGTAGTVFKMRTKNDPSNKPGDNTLWPAVDFFIEAGEESEEEDEDETEEDETEETDEDEEGSDEDEDEDESDEEEEAPKKKKGKKVEAEEDEDEEESDDEDESDDDEDEDESEDEDEDEDSDEDSDDEDEDDSDEDEEEAPKKKAKSKVKQGPKGKAKKKK